MYEYYPNPMDEPPEWLRRRKTKQERAYEKWQDEQMQIRIADEEEQRNEQIPF